MAGVRPMLARCDSALGRMEHACGLLSGAVVGLLILLASVQILGRKFFNSPLPGFIDWVEQAMAVVAFLGLAYCQRQGGHMRMDIVVSRLRGRLRAGLEATGVLLSAFIIAVLVCGSWLHFERAFDWSAPMFSRDSTIDIGLPLWPAKLLVSVSLSFLLLRMVLQLWDYSRALLLGAPPLLERREELPTSAD